MAEAFPEKLGSTIINKTFPPPPLARSLLCDRMSTTSHILQPFPPFAIVKCSSLYIYHTPNPEQRWCEWCG